MQSAKNSNQQAERAERARQQPTAAVTSATKSPLPPIHDLRPLLLMNAAERGAGTELDHVRENRHPPR
jgi:hypothetical protein